MCAAVAELADAQDSGSCARTGVGVQVPSAAPVLIITRARQIFAWPFLVINYKCGLIPDYDMLWVRAVI